MLETQDVYTLVQRFHELTSLTSLPLLEMTRTKPGHARRGR